MLHKRLQDPEFRKNIGELHRKAHWAILDSGEPDNKTRPNPNGGLHTRMAELFLLMMEEVGYIDILREDPP